MNEIVVLCTAGNEKNSHLLAEQLVSRKLAACVNIVPGITSYYFWEDKLVKDQEFLLIIKTVEEVYPELESAIKELHEYSVPEIIALRIQHGSKEYLTWVEKNVKLG